MLEKYPDVLTIDDVCEILRVGRKAVYALIWRGELQSRRNGREHRIRKQILIEYLDKAA